MLVSIQLDNICVHVTYKAPYKHIQYVEEILYLTSKNEIENFVSPHNDAIYDECLNIIVIFLQ